MRKIKKRNCYENVAREKNLFILTDLASRSPSSGWTDTSESPDSILAGGSS